MNAYGYDLEEQATEVRLMLPGSRSVSSNIFLSVVCCTLNIKSKFHLEKQGVFLTFSQNSRSSLITTVFPHSFIHFAVDTTELLLAVDSLRQLGLPSFPTFFFCYGISILGFLVLQYRPYLLCMKKIFISHNYQLCIQ